MRVSTDYDYPTMHGFLIALLSMPAASCLLIEYRQPALWTPMLLFGLCVFVMMRSFTEIIRFVIRSELKSL